jgi:hypothetical protein
MLLFMDYPNRRSDLASLRRGVRAGYDHGERGHSERNANANSPIGLAKGRGASPTRIRLPARRTALRQALSHLDQVEVGPPVPIWPRGLPRSQRPRSQHAFQPP